jgi:hypothetical protein
LNCLLVLFVYEGRKGGSIVKYIWVFSKESIYLTS